MITHEIFESTDLDSDAIPMLTAGSLTNSSLTPIAARVRRRAPCSVSFLTFCSDVSRILISWYASLSCFIFACSASENEF